MAAAAAVVGAVLMIGGNIKSNLDQAKAERENAKAYNDQANYARSASARKMYLLERQQGDFRGKQKAMIAKSGVSFSGSALDAFSDTSIEQYYERLAAEAEANQEIKTYEFRADASKKRARALTDPMTIMFQSGGTALSAYSSASNASGGGSGKTTNTQASAWTNGGHSYAATS